MIAMKHLYALFAALGISLASTGLHAHSMDDAQALADQWAQAFNSRDARVLAALYRDDAEVSQHNVATLVGRDSIRASFKADPGKGDLLSVLTVTSTLDGTDMTLVHGTYRMLDRTSGAEMESGHFAQIWRLVGGEWLIDRDVWSDHAQMHDKSHHHVYDHSHE